MFKSIIQFSGWLKSDRFSANSSELNVTDKHTLTYALQTIKTKKAYDQDVQEHTQQDY